MTIAQQLNVTSFPFSINDKDNKEIYFENSDGTWGKSERDARGNPIRYEDSDGYWNKREYDAQSKEIRFESSDGYWCKTEYDAQSNTIRYENSDGFIIDNRPKIVELTLQQIADKLGIDVKQLKIKD